MRIWVKFIGGKRRDASFAHALVRIGNVDHLHLLIEGAASYAVDADFDLKNPVDYGHARPELACCGLFQRLLKLYARVPSSLSGIMLYVRPGSTRTTRKGRRRKGRQWVHGNGGSAVLSPVPL